MALKYECDVCGVINEPVDTYGPGVTQSSHLHIIELLSGEGNQSGYLEYGVRRWADVNENKVAQSQTFIAIVPLHAQMCGACMGRSLKKMVKELWPDDSDTGSEGSDSNVQSVRAEREVPESDTDKYAERCRCFYKGAGKGYESTPGTLVTDGCPVHGDRGSPGSDGGPGGETVRGTSGPTPEESPTTGWFGP